MDAEQPVSKSIRGSTWSDEEIRCLLNIWSEQKIQEELDNSTRSRRCLHVSRMRGYFWQREKPIVGQIIFIS